MKVFTADDIARGRVAHGVVRLLGLAAAAGLATAAGVGTAAAAVQAPHGTMAQRAIHFGLPHEDTLGPSNVSCTGTVTVTYTPGVTRTAQHVAFTGTGTLTNCYSPDGDDTGLDSGGTFTVHGSGTLTCQGLSSETSTLAISWNNGRSTTVNLIDAAEVDSNLAIQANSIDSNSEDGSGTTLGSNILSLNGVVFSVAPDLAGASAGGCSDAGGLTQGTGDVSLTFNSSL
jgi:hypothetical protein